jgi:hypothetical protein
LQKSSICSNITLCRLTEGDLTSCIFWYY